jgi:hypothetical protein
MTSEPASTAQAPLKQPLRVRQAEKRTEDKNRAEKTREQQSRHLGWASPIDHRSGLPDWISPLWVHHPWVVMAVQLPLCLPLTWGGHP